MKTKRNIRGTLRKDFNENIDVRLFIKAVVIFLAFICLVLFAVWSAKAAEIEIGTGTTHYKHGHNGVWYQEAYPHEFDLNAVPMSLGVVFQGERNLYRMEFLSLGSMFNKSLATWDHEYYPGTTAAPFANFDGRGSVSGVILSAVRPFNVWGLPLYGEAGLFVFRHKWNISMHDMKGNLLTEFQREPEINYSPVVGVGIRGNGIDVGIRYLYLDAPGGEGAMATPPLATHAYTMMLKVYF